MKRFILSTVIAVDADTPEQASELLEQHFPHDMAWHPLGEHVEVFAPVWPPLSVEDAMEQECTCPPELLERGGFRGGCPVHG